MKNGLSLSDEYTSSFIIDVGEPSRCYERTRLLIFEADAQLITRLVECAQPIISCVAAAPIPAWIVKPIHEEVRASLHIVGTSFSCR